MSERDDDPISEAIKALREQAQSYVDAEELRTPAKLFEMLVPGSADSVD